VVIENMSQVVVSSPNPLFMVPSLMFRKSCGIWNSFVHCLLCLRNGIMEG
jgi:hypothetical protein